MKRVRLTALAEFDLIIQTPPPKSHFAGFPPRAIPADANTTAAHPPRLFNHWDCELAPHTAADSAEATETDHAEGLPALLAVLRRP